MLDYSHDFSIIEGQSLLKLKLGAKELAGDRNTLILLNTNLAICNIYSLVDVAKGSAAYFTYQLIFAPYDKLRASTGRFRHFRNLKTLKQNIQQDKYARINLIEKKKKHTESKFLSNITFWPKKNHSSIFPSSR